MIQTSEIIVGILLGIFGTYVWYYLKREIERFNDIKGIIRVLKKFRNIDSDTSKWLVELVYQGYKKFDKSHAYDHIVDVLNNLYLFAGKDARIEAVIAAAIHDMIDIKYQLEWLFQPDELKKFLADKLDEKSAEVIMAIITNMSWSAELRGENKVLSKLKHEKMRRVVQYADWLTSTGYAGLVKSYNYNKYKLNAEDTIGNVMGLFEIRFLKYYPQIQKNNTDNPSTGCVEAEEMAKKLHEEILSVKSREDLENVIHTWM